ncbi:hypothetical protein SMACR_03489 [Sordaria macrospora]|uniref:Sulfhydryl oxidase n=2 Tax=Sordaria macrospora TaxID=5147 RepID=F7VVB8_SORMK|nr:uncharacterized protein SMAC_03489 [Sordaria macrospora k-hell]KAA8629219.1 hypothetical protein SMACR_03489 [Sordaria macrospora]KAH7625922.1 ERV/ALR sulfhydryl oxidase domain-containing protein [Sordaria sp. MPI-SDFR-AT-0083]WPJ65886.1 hypothetical protein SMAC4_03489 [Sordaria macrospora]CCC09459.1 unnamed protein product [Sordaria macrospora k-hell]
MATNATDNGPTQIGATATAPVDGTAAEPPKKFPKGVVLGKDGKPCRSCTSFGAWASQAKATLKTNPDASSTAASTMASAASSSATTLPQRRTDCPADVEQLGRSTWTLLHSIAATYPPAPTPTEQNDLKLFMGLFAKLYPCWVCAEDFQQYIKKEEPKTGSRGEFGNWLCEAHNEVNRKLGKPTFDCSKWQERWRTGWKDGSCD